MLRRRRTPLVRVAVALAIAIALVEAGTAPAETAPSGADPYAGETCWLISDSAGLRLHVGGTYLGLPALCTINRP